MMLCQYDGFATRTNKAPQLPGYHIDLDRDVYLFVNVDNWHMCAQILYYLLADE